MRQRGAGHIPRPGELAGSSVLCCDELTIDTSSCATHTDRSRSRCKRREYALVTHLARDPQRIWTRHELLRDVWGYRSQGATLTLDSHASRLRCKLAAAGAIGWIVAAWGVGYRLAP